MSYYHTKYVINKRKKKPYLKFLIWFIIVIILTGGAGGYLLYQVIYKPNVWTADGKNVSIFIPTQSNFDDVKQLLFEKGLIIHRNNFIWWAQKKKYPDLVKPGHYILKNNMTNKEVIKLLRSGNQMPVKVIFNNVRDIYQLAGRISKQIEADSLSLLTEFTNVEELNKMSLNPEIISTIFIPNTYEFYWNTSAKGFLKRMYEEYLGFWNTDRTTKAEKLNMTIPEVITLASIIEKETNKNDEKTLIAGVYINRLDIGWRLQADPTLIFALDDYSIKRVLNVHKELDSPYNTYKHGGLPPGPICIPSISSIDAVLNPQNEGYLFFCAKDDLSGYHEFARTNTEHTLNARKYQKALDNMRIYK
ncbi:MAG: endolytic transglycosylase MltG [Bacteroidetes bacterium]|nr:endolytic transglycosylase MltG [Bacteroidota bacterium]MBL6943645.1 endolytic transglycosylase MltG [Bacteroidales bacterium]